MMFMPATGLAMGYYGGKGVPFFWTKVEGAETVNKSVAKWAYVWHKRVGKAFEVMVGLHVCGAGVHMLKQQNPLARISPFASAGVLSVVGEDGDLDDEDSLLVEVGDKTPTENVSEKQLGLNQNN